jgi:hypothetical protein
LILHFANSKSAVAQKAFHARYEELIADPVAFVERIYAHFGYEMTDEFRANMREYIAENRQHKHGKPSYSLEEFGLDKAQVETAFAAYNQAFRERVAVSESA